MIGIGLHIGNRVMGGGGAAFDVDAQAFFDRVTVAGGTLTTTEKNATNQLVLDMKTAGIWTAMKAVYPMVGASAAACAQNLKSSSFTGSFSGGVTFASTGVTGNGLTGYMDTGLIPSTTLSASSAHLSFYSRSSNSLGEYDFARNNYAILVQYSGNTFYVNLDAGGSYAASATVANGLGFYVGSRLNNTTVQGFKNTSKLINSALTSTLETASLWVWGNGLPFNYSSKECAFASAGDGLTDIQAGNFYTAVQAFNTTLGRQV